MKKCPFCMGEIPEEAVKCQHCGEFIDGKYKKTQTLVTRGMFQGSAMIFCPECHYEGKTRKIDKKGSSRILLLLLFLGFIPGVIYHFRRGSYYFICPKCGNKHIKSLKKE